MHPRIKKACAFLDAHFEKPFLGVGLMAMILIICYQTFYRYSITALIQFVEPPPTHG